MILDAALMYSNKQAITTTVASTEYIDHGPLTGSNKGRDLGVGEDLYIVVIVTTALAGAGGTVAVTIETDDNSAFSSATTTRTLGTFGAAAAAGSRIVARLGPGDINEQFSRLKYTAGAALTGSLEAFITKNPDQYTAYHDNVTIS